MDLNKWVESQLADRGVKADGFGLDYILTLAKSSSSLAKLRAGLAEFEPALKEDRGLAEELFFRVGKSPVEPQKQLKRPRDYTFVEAPALSRQHVVDQQVGKATAVRVPASSSNGDPEREAMVKRALQRDKIRKAGGAGKQSLVLTAEEKRSLIPQLRQESRMNYLDKRQSQQIALFKRKLEEDRKMFRDQQLSKTQHELRKLDWKVMALAEQTAQGSRQDTDQHYLPPIVQAGKKEDRVQKALKARYAGAKGQAAQGAAWERQQELKSKAKPDRATEQKYSIIPEDDQIKFVKLQVLQEVYAHRRKEEEEAAKAERALRRKQRRLRGQQVSSDQQEKKQVQEEELSEVQKGRRQLPIYSYQEQILTFIRDNGVIILVGETGSGKTTQLPQFLFEVGYGRLGMIGCTQPRRVAAMSVAARVAEQMGCSLGEQVGYSVRFEQCSSERTVVKYMTDGMLMKELSQDPFLQAYSVLIIDEAHERSLQTDLVLALLKDIRKSRPDLKLVISSATLEAEKFATYFGNAPVIRVPGRRFAVDIFYAPAPEADYVEATIVTVLQIHITHQEGDILCFLTGQEEIESCAETLTARLRSLGSKVAPMVVLPIYSALPVDQQRKIFKPAPKGCRKVVLATNIAETSITIDSVVFVVDCGLVKQNNYCPKTNSESLLAVPISKASASQRAGRAGRVCPGKCFRLYTLWSYQNELEESTTPEIKRSNLSSVVLQLMSLGVKNLVEFDFLDPPNHQLLLKSLELLYNLQALNDDGELTRVGRMMAEFPLNPLLSRALVGSQAHKCVQQVLTIVAMLSASGCFFFRPKGQKLQADKAKLNFFMPGGDPISLLRVYQCWQENQYSSGWALQNFLQHKSLEQARNIRAQLERLLVRTGVDVEDPELSAVSDDAYTNVRKGLLQGFFMQVASRTRNGYRTVRQQISAEIHPSSMLFREQPLWVVYCEMVQTSRMYLRNVLEVQADWLVEVAPHYHQKKDLYGLKN